MAGKSKLQKKKLLILAKNRLLRRISNNEDSQVVNADTSSGCIEQEKKSTPHIENENEDIIADNSEVIGTLTEEESFLVETENGDSVSARKNEAVQGMRIINIAKFFKDLQEVSSHGNIDCGLKSVEIISERKLGLVSNLKLKCNMCNETFILCCNDPEIDVNINTVAGAVAIGCGNTQLNELLAAMDLPQISHSIFAKRMDTVNKVWEKEVAISMNEAANEERRLAIEDGKVSANGIPLIDVIADGCWGKRSYKKNYSSLSGAAAIIGKRTGKILFMAVKNKYCCICAQAAKKNVTPKEHECYKNYSGSSTGMESTILVEGFKNSIQMHNLIYARLISDGDANTYAKLLQSRPYKNITIEKIECRNHLLRNLCNKLQAISTDTKYLIKYRKYITKQRILSIRKVIVTAIRNYKNSGNVTNLHTDIMLAAEHAFGIHTTCKAYFCSKVGEDEQIDRDIFTNSLWHRIKFVLTHIAAHSRSLIEDVDSNIVERYHSIVAKFVGGKRVNFSQKYQYHMRCNAAALSFNTHKPLSLLQKAIMGRSPSRELKRLEDRKRKRLQLAKKYNRVRKRLYDRNAESSKNYGDQCLKPDMSDEMLEESKKIFLNNLVETTKHRNQIERNTVLQSGSSEWLELRRKILTASNFGRVIKRRNDVSCCNLVKDILYRESIGHVHSIKHGQDNENIAKEQLSIQENVKIEPCGLFLDQEIPFLGASPDGVIDENTIVEIKCPITAYKLGLGKAIEEKKVLFYKKNPNGNYMINKEHNWWYQIQGQLHITGKSKCMLGIWSGEKFPVKIEIIVKDDIFWDTKMKNKLVKFYTDCLLPELVDPRNTRNMAIRDPSYIVTAIQGRKRKTEEDKENKKKQSKKRAMMVEDNSQDTNNTNTRINDSVKTLSFEEY